MAAGNGVKVNAQLSLGLHLHLCVANSYFVAKISVNSKSCHVVPDCYDGEAMRDPAILFIHLLAAIARLMRPGGARAVVAESLLVKHQLMILNRGRERAPNFRPMDRIVTGFCTLFIL